jgi:hypothetical protein
MNGLEENEENNDYIFKPPDLRQFDLVGRTLKTDLARIFMRMVLKVSLRTSMTGALKMNPRTAPHSRMSMRRTITGPQRTRHRKMKGGSARKRLQYWGMGSVMNKAVLKGKEEGSFARTPGLKRLEDAGGIGGISNS